jgi:phasin family protein
VPARRAGFPSIHSEELSMPSFSQPFAQSFAQPLSPAVKAHFDAQYALFSDMSQKVFDSVRQIGDLNVQVAQSLLDESLTHAKQVMFAGNPYEAIAIATAQTQPAVEKLRAYQEHLNNIAARTQLDLAKAAEAHAPNASRTAAAVVDEVARKASEETEKTAQRQKAAMEKLVKPAERGADHKSQSARAGT